LTDNDSFIAEYESHPAPRKLLPRVSEQVVINAAFGGVDLDRRVDIFCFDTPAVPEDSARAGYLSWLGTVFSKIELLRQENCALILLCHDRKGHSFLKSVVTADLAQSWGWLPFRQFVWLRQEADFHRSRYAYLTIQTFRKGNMPARSESDLRYKDIIRLPGVVTPGLVGELPVPLLKSLIGLFAAPGSDKLVIDPFAGTGSTAAACLELNLPCISVELLPERAQAIVERLRGMSG